MNKKTIIPLIGVLLLIVIPALAMIESNFYEYKNTLNPVKCSDEIEKLKLCIENSKIIVNSGEQVRVNLFWVNISDSNRRIGRQSSDYSIIVKDKSNKKLIPVFEQKFMEKQKQIQESGEKEKGMVARVISGSYKGLYAEANGIEKDVILLNDKMYDYDLTSKGIYRLTISKKVESLEKGKTIEFVLNGIEIQVK